jgi:hypothetical protein
MRVFYFSVEVIDEENMVDAHKQQDVVERLVYNSRNVLSLSAVDRHGFVFPKAIQLLCTIIRDSKLIQTSFYTKLTTSLLTCWKRYSMTCSVSDNLTKENKKTRNVIFQCPLCHILILQIVGYLLSC